MPAKQRTAAQTAALPWKVRDAADGPSIRDANGERVAEVYYSADNELIVRAVNSHDGLVEHASAALLWLEAEHRRGLPPQSMAAFAIPALTQKLRAALALAKGQP